MKVLLCLLSEQHVPNLLSVHHYKPDRLVLVETVAMQKRRAADNFQTALLVGGLDYRQRCDVELLEAEDNLDAIRAVLRRSFGRYPSAEWIANVTGGTKPMSIAAFEFFKATAGHIIYTNFSRPNVLMSLDSAKEEECPYKLSIKEFLSGYGFEFRKTDDKISQSEKRARSWAECSRIIAAQSSSQDLLHLSDDERKTARQKGWNVQPGQLNTQSLEVAAAIHSAFGFQGNGDTDSLHGQVDKYSVEFLTGGWLEVFFWDLLSRHAEALAIWDIRLGLDIGRPGDRTGNEFDVAFMHEFGLAILECKSGSQEHDSGGEILYKVEAVTRQFRALRVRSYLATTGTNIFDKHQNVKDSIKNRSSIYNCRILTADQIRLLANPDISVQAIRGVLFNSVDSR